MAEVGRGEQASKQIASHMSRRMSGTALAPHRPSTATTRPRATRRSEMSPRWARTPRSSAASFRLISARTQGPRAGAHFPALDSEAANSADRNRAWAPDTAQGPAVLRLVRHWTGLTLLAAAAGHCAPSLPTAYCWRAPGRAAVAPAARPGFGCDPTERRFLAHSPRLPDTGWPLATGTVRPIVRHSASQGGCRPSLFAPQRPRRRLPHRAPPALRVRPLAARGGQGAPAARHRAYAATHGPGGRRAPPSAHALLPAAISAAGAARSGSTSRRRVAAARTGGRAVQERVEAAAPVHTWYAPAACTYQCGWETLTLCLCALCRLPGFGAHIRPAVLRAVLRSRARRPHQHYGAHSAPAPGGHRQRWRQQRRA